MSYAEHGSRIFFANKCNAATHFLYGDHALPKQRLEGRLKLYDSCSDIRAWSPKRVENSRYFREINERDSAIGRIVPLNVVIDNIIQFNSQTQDELRTTKKELRKYKSLTLTPNQEQQLQNFETKQETKDALVNINTSIPTINSNSCLAIRIPFKKHFENIRDKSTLIRQSDEVYSFTGDIEGASNFSNSNYHPNLADFNEKPSRWVEYVDIAIQVKLETRNVGTETDAQMDEYLNKILTISVMSQTSITYKYSDEDNSTTELDNSSLQTNNDKEQRFECDASCSESSQNTDTSIESYREIHVESNYDLHESIIEKDAKIIHLKNEIGVRDAKLEELEIELIEKRGSINAQQRDMKILFEELLKLRHRYNYEVEGLKQQLHDYQQKLNNKCETCHLQSQEIKKLQKKLQEMEQSIKKTALEQMKQVLQEKNELRKQNYEQSCILADQEEEIKHLLDMIKETSIAYKEQDIKISQYEERLLSMKQEIDDFFNNLQRILNNLEEFNGFCEDVCNCTNCDLDINEEANNILQNISIIITRFQSYKVESQNLLQQIEDMKRCMKNNKQIYFGQNSRNTIPEGIYYESDMNPGNTSGKNNLIALDTRRNKNAIEETEFKDISNLVNSESSLHGTNDNFNVYKYKTERHNCIVKWNKRGSLNEFETEIVKYFSYFLTTLHSLTQKLKIYVEIERPFIIKLIHDFYDILKDIQPAIISEDITLRKEQISKLYSKHREEYEKHNSYSEELPTDLIEIQNEIRKFIEAILYQFLNETLRAEKENLYEHQINHAFETYFKSCINRVNIALEGAEDQHIQIIEEIGKQQKELQKKDSEIANLKEEVVRRREENCLNRKKLERIVLIKEQLSKMATELNTKNTLISTLENELSVCNKSCNALKKKQKNLNNLRHKLLKEYQSNKRNLEIKNKTIKKLSQQLQNLSKVKDLNIVLKNKLKEVEKKFSSVQLENSVLQEQINLTKEEIIIGLRNNVDKSEDISMKKIVEYENSIKEKNREIIQVKNENEILNVKMKDIESELVKMNQTIISLTEQNGKINLIYILQEDLSELSKNEKKLKAELMNLKDQLINEQNNNKKLNNNLNTFLRENEDLRNNIEYWKNQNSELSTKLSNEFLEEKLRSELYGLSSKIQERLLILKTQFSSEKYLSNQRSNQQFQNKYTVRQNINRDAKSEDKDHERKIKENEIEEIEMQQLINVANIEKDASENDGLKMRLKIKDLEDKLYENQNEIEKLLTEIEIRNCKIRDYKETIRHLTEENINLRAILKSRVEEYQTKLTLLKKNYDSSLNAVNERHKENIEKLQKQFEDNLTSERIFDSENWLQSLNMKELMELHERINVIINGNRNMIYTKGKNQYFYENDIQKEFCAAIEVKEKLQIPPKNIYEKEPLPNELASSILKEQNNSHLQNQWPQTIFGGMQKYPILQMQYDKPSLERNVRLYEEEFMELENKCTKEKQAERDNTFDRQRWNFINQCSAYHKLSNTYEYSRTIYTD